MKKTLTCLVALLILSAQPIRAQSELDQKVRAITDRPEFRHASFGIEIYSKRAGRVIYRHNADQLFTAASTTKLVTEGTILDLLGADYRFHTKVYRNGKISADGVLNGELVLVASGDPNLSNRIQPDGSLAFVNEDHSYGGAPLPGEPLCVLREIVDQVVAHGVKRISGRVLVDARLFAEGTPEGGTGAIISPMVLNDNFVDLTLTPGKSEQSAALMSVSPETSHVRFINKVITADAKAKTSIDSDEAENADGLRTVTIRGRIPLGGAVAYAPWVVHEPSRFAESALISILKERGVLVDGHASGTKPDFHVLAASYTSENIVAEHVSPPIAEDVKVTLKVSQNLHASMGPYLLGSLIGHKSERAHEAGFGLERDLLKKAGLDLNGAFQSDGAGAQGMFSPDFMVHYLMYRQKQKDFDVYRKALPVLGKDGTLADIQKQSAAAGHVFAKTGTLISDDLLNARPLLTGKGLAGYIDAANGDHLIFAAYVNRVAIPDDSAASKKIVAEAMGEIASVAYGAGAESATDRK